MDMEIPANKARLEFALDGTPYPVIAIQGEERLNQGFYFQLDIQIALRLQFQVEPTVLGKQLQHVIQEPDSR